MTIKAWSTQKWHVGQKVHAKARRYEQQPWYTILEIAFCDDGRNHCWDVTLASPYGFPVEKVDIEDLSPLQEPSDLLIELL